MKLTLVTTMRNEALHLLEWLAHHRALGVDHILVFTNDCDDGTPAMLEAVPFVTHVAQDGGDKPPQWRALKAAWEHPVVVGADWVGCFDCDEFINPRMGSIPEMIAQANADAICLRWRLFGNNDEVELSGRATTERFRRAAPKDMLYPPLASFVKTLFRRDGPFRQFGVHRPRQKNPENHGLPVIVDGDGQAVDPGFAADDNRILLWGRPVDGKLAELNHYALRSVSEFLLKRDRGLPNHRKKSIDLSYWVERNFNLVEESSIDRHRAGKQAVLEELMAIRGLAELQDEGRAWHRARLSELLRDPETLALYGRLILSQGSTPPASERAVGLVRRYQEADHG